MKPLVVSRDMSLSGSFDNAASLVMQVCVAGSMMVMLFLNMHELESNSSVPSRVLEM